MEQCPKCGYKEPVKETYADLKCQWPDRIEYGPDVNNHNDHHKYINGDKKFDIVCAGDLGKDYFVWLSSNKGISFYLPPSEKKIQRAELRLSNIDDDCFLSWGDTVYLSYELTINSRTKIESGVHFTQVWQNDCGPAVPFTMTMYDEQGLQHKAVARYKKSNLTYYPEIFGAEDLFIKTHFIYEFTPSIDHGCIKIWINNNNYTNPTYNFNGPWACHPDPEIKKHDLFDIRVGLYGRGQQAEQLVTFDNVKLQNYFPG